MEWKLSIDFGGSHLVRLNCIDYYISPVLLIGGASRSVRINFIQVSFSYFHEKMKVDKWRCFSFVMTHWQSVCELFNFSKKRFAEICSLSFQVVIFIFHKRLWFQTANQVYVCALPLQIPSGGSILSFLVSGHISERLVKHVEGWCSGPGRNVCSKFVYKGSKRYQFSSLYWFILLTAWILMQFGMNAASIRVKHFTSVTAVSTLLSEIGC